MNVDFDVERLDDIIDDIVDEIAPRTAAVMREITEEVFAHAKNEWPVATGKSKAALRRSVRLTAEGIVAVVECNVPYAWAIREKNKRRSAGLGLTRTSRGRRVTQVLIERPFRKRWRKVESDMLDEMGAAVRGA